MTKFNGAIFDLDGTLCDTIKTIKYYSDMALKRFDKPEISEKDYKLIVGNGAKTQLERMLDIVGSDGVDFDEMFNFYIEKYESDPLYLTEVYDGIFDLLKKLKEKGFYLGVLSNKPDKAAREVVKTLFGDQLFDTVRGQTDDIPKKPAPDGAIKIINEWKVDKDSVLYIGDTGVDVKTGKAAALFTIGVLWGFREREELKCADLIIEKPEEIIKFLEGDLK